MKVGVKKVLRAGMMPARTWVEIDETYGSSSSSRQE